MSKKIRPEKIRPMTEYKSHYPDLQKMNFEDCWKYVCQLSYSNEPIPENLPESAKLVIISAARRLEEMWKEWS